jgi:hypothetical protein
MTALPDTPRLPGDRFTVERELGRGGMSTVYLAHDGKHDRRVAVKLLVAEWYERREAGSAELGPAFHAVVGGMRCLRV